VYPEDGIIDPKIHWANDATKAAFELLELDEDKCMRLFAIRQYGTYSVDTNEIGVRDRVRDLVEDGKLTKEQADQVDLTQVAEQVVGFTGRLIAEKYPKRI
jgi:hypothetical protein